MPVQKTHGDRSGTGQIVSRKIDDSSAAPGVSRERQQTNSGPSGALHNRLNRAENTSSPPLLSVLRFRFAENTLRAFNFGSTHRSRRVIETFLPNCIVNGYSQRTVHVQRIPLFKGRRRANGDRCLSIAVVETREKSIGPPNGPPYPIL